MMFLEALLRFSTFGLLLGLATISYRDRVKIKEGWLLPALCVSLMALMISTSSSALNAPEQLIAICRFIDTPNTVLAWLFVKSLFSDDFRVNKFHTFLALAYCVPLWFMWLNVYYEWGLISFWHGVILNLYALSLYIHLSVNIIRDWSNDLIESRRKLRLFFVITIVLFVCFLIGTELFAQHLTRDFLNTLKVLVTFSLTLVGFLWFLQISSGHIISVKKTKQHVLDKFNSSELRLYNNLQNFLEQEQLWRESNLTITLLAKKVGVGEHKLRAFINKRLGYTNFSEYLQEYRMKEVKRVLSDPHQSDKTLLSIALDSGFNSISTFNRVFRQKENITPTQYRELYKDISTSKNT